MDVAREQVDFGVAVDDERREKEMGDIDLL